MNLEVMERDLERLSNNSIYNFNLRINRKNFTAELLVEFLTVANRSMGINYGNKLEKEISVIIEDEYSYIINASKAIK